MLGETTSILDYVIEIAATIAALIIAYLILRRVLETVVRRAVKSNKKHESKQAEKQREDTLISILKTAVLILVWVVGVIIILSEIGVNWAALLSGAGIIGIIVGMGSQNVMKDVFKGFFIIVEDQYRIGDVVQLDVPTGPWGLVEDLSVRVTKLRDLDGSIHIVPNGDAGIISNYSYQYGVAMVDINVPYSTSVDKAKDIINKVGIELAGDEEWKGLTTEPIQFYRVDSFNESSMTLKSLGKIVPPNQWNAAAAFRERVKIAFEKQGVEIAIPQVIVKGNFDKPKH